MAPPSPFSVAGMASTSTAHHNHNHNPNLNTWAGPGASGTLTNSFTDTLSQSRSHYQPGYLMSASQSNNSPPRTDEAPVVQTKAKMNHAFSLSRGAASTSDFGMDSMFQNSRQRQPMADEDAPPMSSVNDIPTATHADSGAPSFAPRASAFSRARPPPAPVTPASSAPMLYIIVFGYPPDKYTVTAEYFASLGAHASAPDPHAEITNAFRIGYADPADALRAVRKSGDVLGGRWMVGVKWADAAQAEALLSQPLPRHSSPDMDVDAPGPGPAPHAYGGSTPVVGTPIKLAPSASAFRRGAGTPSAKPAPPPQAQAAAPGWPADAAPAGEKGKGVLGQVSDMIFGW
ncbi:hypothetical protein B0H15DRAFT_825165 [Mycena belliarum]|uniref:RRM Nup35-type domain-containing protein n=1 Tax=Mycena belliarum TaxID=1033014 RepID=A0AAD6UE12_9AGAR|nr:hypothetical protein B0H15DRAFT_825165 [Mycena belliae]